MQVVQKTIVSGTFRVSYLLSDNKYAVLQYFFYGLSLDFLERQRQTLVDAQPSELHTHYLRYLAEMRARQVAEQQKLRVDKPLHISTPIQNDGYSVWHIYYLNIRWSYFANHYLALGF